MIVYELAIFAQVWDRVHGVLVYLHSAPRGFEALVAKPCRGSFRCRYDTIDKGKDHEVLDEISHQEDLQELRRV
jgi:hypothetical protein